MRILGVDCGSHITGFGIIESRERVRRAVHYGTLRAPGNRQLADRLRCVADGLDEIIREHRPDEVAVEDIFYSRNFRSAAVVAHVRGVALLSGARAGLPVASYAPQQVKSSVVGHGRAAKSQVGQMIAMLLGVRGPIESEDASDALAVAYCHASLRTATWLPQEVKEV